MDKMCSHQRNNIIDEEKTSLLLLSIQQKKNILIAFSINVVTITPFIENGLSQFRQYTDDLFKFFSDEYNTILVNISKEN